MNVWSIHHCTAIQTIRKVPNSVWFQRWTCTTLIVFISVCFPVLNLFRRILIIWWLGENLFASTFAPLLSLKKDSHFFKGGILGTLPVIDRSNLVGLVWDNQLQGQRGMILCLPFLCTLSLGAPHWSVIATTVPFTVMSWISVDCVFVLIHVSVGNLVNETSQRRSFFPILWRSLFHILHEDACCAGSVHRPCLRDGPVRSEESGIEETPPRIQHNVPLSSTQSRPSVRDCCKSVKRYFV